MRFLSGGPRVREYLTGVTKMTEQRNSRIALLAVVMLLSGAFLGLLVSDNASAARYDLNGFVSDNNSNVSITILDRDSGYKKTTSTLEDGYYSFTNVESGDYDIMYMKEGYLSIRNNLSVSADGPLDTVSMVASPAGATTVSGTVTGNGIAVSGATVTLFPLPFLKIHGGDTMTQVIPGLQLPTKLEIMNLLTCQELLLMHV